MVKIGETYVFNEREWTVDSVLANGTMVTVRYHWIDNNGVVRHSERAFRDLPTIQQFQDGLEEADDAD